MKKKMVNTFWWYILYSVISLSLCANIQKDVTKEPSDIPVTFNNPNLTTGSNLEQSSPDSLTIDNNSEGNSAIVGDSLDNTKITEDEMAKKLSEYDEASIAICNRVQKAAWDVATDVGNKVKEELKIKAVAESAKFSKEWHDKYWKNANENDYKDESIKRQLHQHKILGSAVLSPEKLDKYTKLITDMSSIYNAATVCPYKNENCKDSERLTLDPDIASRFTKSRDYDELKYLWMKWRDESGKKMPDKYQEYVDLMNEIGVGNGFKNAAEYWQDAFEDEHFEDNIDELWTQVKPLYDKLHAYMRYKLIAIYGDKIDRTSEDIPAHLLGNMWAQTWENLYEDTKPYKDNTMIDVTDKLHELKYDARKMFETSNEFYMSLGLPTNEMSYTGESVITKPTNRTIQCHASAWDFCDSKDFRIKMCTNINQEDLIVIHHEMGHIQYYIQYKDQPSAFRRGANPGFHEAVGDTMALSVANPRHLVKIGLLDKYTNSHESNMNSLYREALQRVAFLPFGLLIDKWRWDVFSKKITRNNWNSHWWNLRRKYQKVSAPVERNENDFDPGAKFHVPASSKYISYFVSHILEFSFYKSLCIEAGEYDIKNPQSNPLHHCDFYKSEKAGKKLSAGLKLGGSKHWSDVLEIMTGERKIKADAILEYFQPLVKVLDDAIVRLKDEDEVRKQLEIYDKESTSYCQKLQNADWDTTTDLENAEKEQAHKDAVAESAKFTKAEYINKFKKFANQTFIDETISRKIKLIGQLGTDALDETDLNEFTGTMAEMIKIYNQATFCSYDKPNCTKDELLTLDPEIVGIMGKSKNYDELTYTWTKWHNSTGIKMKQLYKKYIGINNKAANLNGYKDAGEMWLSAYEDPKFIEKMKEIWKKIEPLYLEIHTYTKKKLATIYGEDKVDPNGRHIPAHLLGNMWAQSWENLYDRIKPFNGSELDITAALIRNKYTPLKIFEESDRFYSSLGLESNKMSYTGNSIIEKPPDRLIVCHASAWDLCDGKDFRIKQCTSVDQHNFITAHHEMGHIQYYILYKDLPLVFRQGANPGFHEAVGDIIALSVSTPKHLKKIGLLDEYTDTSEDTLNALLKMALTRVVFLPFALTLDLYRYDLFSGQIAEQDWNKHWENLREDFQRVKSPMPRSDSVFFDAGGKNHVPTDYPYIAYFVSHIVQFQVYKSLCIAAGEYDPNNPKKRWLHECDIEGSIVAGQRIRDGLSLGKSKHWSEVLKVLTDGETEINADALLEYFKPLHEYLEKENGKEKAHFVLWFLLGGFSLVAIGVAIAVYAIYYYNRK